MEKLVDLGLVKSIGVSNFNSEQIERLLANCRIKPVNNQVIYDFSAFDEFFSILRGQFPLFRLQLHTKFRQFSCRSFTKTRKNHAD